MNIKYFVLLLSFTLVHNIHGAKNDLLRDAIVDADIVALKNLFKNGQADINDTIGSYPMSPLQFVITRLQVAEETNNDANKKNLIEIMKFLIEKNAPLNQTYLEETPLHRASYFNSPDITKILLWSGADIDALDNESGNTALHIAVLYNKPETVSLLVKHGAKTSIKNKKGLTAYDIVADEKTYPDYKIDREKMRQVFNEHKTKAGLKKIRERETVKPSCDVKFTHK